MKISFVFLSLILCVTSNTYAEPYFNLSAGYGSTNYYQASDLNYMLYTDVNQESSNNSGVSLSFNMGYESVFNKESLGFEVGMVVFGQSSLEASGVDTPTAGDGTRDVKVETDIQALTFSFLMKKNLQAKKSLYGLFGVSLWSSDSKINGKVYDSVGALSGSTSGSESDSGVDVLYGIGFDMNDYSMRLEHYVLGDITTDMFTFGVKF